MVDCGVGCEDRECFWRMPMGGGWRKAFLFWSLYPVYLSDRVHKSGRDEMRRGHFRLLGVLVPSLSIQQST